MTAGRPRTTVHTGPRTWVPNPYTNKKPCIHCGSTERYSSPPYQCKPCQRKAAAARNRAMIIAEQEDRNENDGV